MYRPLHSRFAAALMAVIYLALPGGAWGVRMCAHHDGLNPGAGAETSAADSDQDRHEHGAHEAHAAASEQQDAAHEHDGSHGGCSCLDTCAAAGAPALPVTDVSLDDDEPHAALADLAPAAAAPRITRPHFFLPLQNAPPVVSR